MPQRTSTRTDTSGFDALELRAAVAGAVCDVGILRRMGWTLDFCAPGCFAIDRDSTLWAEKTFDNGGAPVTFRLGMGRFMRRNRKKPGVWEAIPATGRLWKYHWSGTRPLLSFLRVLRAVRALTPDDRDEPDAWDIVLAPTTARVRRELMESVESPGLPLFDDIAWNFGDALPDAPDRPRDDVRLRDRFSRYLEKLNTLAEQGVLPCAERFLAVALPALALPAARPREAALLDRLVTDLGLDVFCRAALALREPELMKTVLGYAARRLEARPPEVPQPWLRLLELAVEIDRPDEALKYFLAAGRVGDSGPSYTRLFRGVVVNFARWIGNGGNPDEADILRVLALLARMEDAFDNPDEAPCLSALLLCFCGRRDMAADALDRLYDAGKKALATQGGADDGNRRFADVMALRKPLVYQCRETVSEFEDDDYLLRAALLAFPLPTLEARVLHGTMPSTRIAGLGLGDLWEGVFPDFKKKYKTILDKLIKNDERELVGCAGLFSLQTSDASSDQAIGLNALAPVDKGVDQIAPLAVFSLLHEEGLSIPVPPSDPDFFSYYPRHFESIIPDFRNGRKHNTTVEYWHYYPYPDNSVAEVKFWNRGGQTSWLYAVMPYYFGDCEAFFPGVPLTAYLYFVATSLNIGETFLPETEVPPDSPFRHDGEFIIFRQEDLPDTSHAVTHLCARVTAVRKVPVVYSSPVYCLTLGTNPVLGCDICAYVHPKVLKKTPEPGMMVWGVGWLGIDAFKPLESEDKYFERTRLLPPPEPTEEYRDISKSIRYFEKPAQGKRRERDSEKEESGEKPLPELTPETFSADYAAYRELRSLVPDPASVFRHGPNPRHISVSAMVGGTLRLYLVEKLIEDEEPSRFLAPGVERLIVRIRDAGDGWNVEYEGFPRKNV